MSAEHRPTRPRLTPAMADVRRAVRASLDGLPSDALVLVALSGGADSLALAAATAFEAPRAGLRAGAVVVDHALQPGSAEVAAAAATAATDLGLAPVEIRRVEVGADGGPEAAAREARYRSLDQVATETGAVAVLLGHTLDDQAETVLLGLARGSGPVSLHGMDAVSGRWRRPMLGVRRETTRASCADLGLDPWDDPHNDDPAYARVRVRHAVLPVLEREVVEQAEEVADHAEAGISLDVRSLAANPAALRQRLIRLAVASEFAVTLSRAQTLEVARLVTDWHGQGPVSLPGITVERTGGALHFAATGAS
jgi:tRNA(Ile)-lysidine synthase